MLKNRTKKKKEERDKDKIRENNERGRERLFVFDRRLTLFAFLLKNFQAKEKLELRWPKGPNLSWLLRCPAR